MATNASKETNTGLRRGLSLWQAVGISVALMAPSMAANINPQGTAGLVGRATPLAFFLAAVAVLPDIIIGLFKVRAVGFGGTSVLIVVGVALDTLQQVESHLLMRHYEGFVKRGRIRGRSRM